MAIVLDVCKHCGQEISSRNGLPDTWFHTDGRQATRTCILEPVGYDACPAHQPCNPICRGRGDDEVIKPVDQTAWTITRPRIGLVSIHGTETQARNVWTRGDKIYQVNMNGWEDVT